MSKENLDDHAFIYFYLLSLSLFGAGVALSAENRFLIMLHGLGRSANSLWVAEQFFRARDYQVYWLGYPSTQKKIFDQLAAQVKRDTENLCASAPNFLTH